MAYSGDARTAQLASFTSAVCPRLGLRSCTLAPAPVTITVPVQRDGVDTADGHRAPAAPARSSTPSAAAPRPGSDQDRRAVAGPARARAVSPAPPPAAVNAATAEMPVQQPAGQASARRSCQHYRHEHRRGAVGDRFDRALPALGRRPHHPGHPGQLGCRTPAFSGTPTGFAT